MLAYAALLVYAFVLPWERIFSLPGVNIITKAAGIGAASLALFAVLFTGRVRRWHALHLAAMLFVVTAAFELLVFHSGQRLPYKFWTFVQLFAVLCIVWELAPTWSRMNGLLLAYVGGAYLAAFGTVVAYRRSSGAGITRYTIGGDANDLAMGLAVALPIAWYLGMTHPRSSVRWACRGYILAGLMAIGLTGSRGGMIVGAIGLSFVPFSITRLTPKRLAMAITMLAVAGTLAVVYVPDRIVARLATTTTEFEDLHVGGRFKLWVAGLQVFVQHPFIGIGTSGFKTAITPILQDASQVAHNSYISVLVEEGILGLVCFLAMLFAAFRAVLPLPQLERRFALVLLATVCMAMMPLTWEDSKVAWFTFALLVGLARARHTAPLPSPPPPTVRAVKVRSAPNAVRTLGSLSVPGRAARRDAGA